MRVSSPTLYGLPETVRIIPTVVFDRKSLQPACTEKMFCTRRRTMASARAPARPPSLDVHV